MPLSAFLGVWAENPTRMFPSSWAAVWYQSSEFLHGRVFSGIQAERWQNDPEDSPSTAVDQVKAQVLKGALWLNRLDDGIICRRHQPKLKSLTIKPPSSHIANLNMSSSPFSSSLSPAAAPSSEARSKCRAPAQEPTPSPPTVLDETTTELSRYADPLQHPPSPSPAPRTATRSKGTTSGHTSIWQGDELDVLGTHFHTLSSEIGAEPNARLTSEAEKVDPDPEDKLDSDWRWRQEEPKGRKEFKKSPHARVLAVDTNSGCCILTGRVGPKRAVQYAHIVPRATPPDDLTVLEYKWGLPYHSLCNDTRFNITLITAQWHIALDADLWAFVPDISIVSRLFTWVVNGGHKKGPISEFWEKEYNNDMTASEAKKPKAPKAQPQTSTSHASSKAADGAKAKTKLAVPTYLYYMLPLDSELDDAFLQRRLPGESFTTEHEYPYSELGALRSHIQPHFVVYALGAKLAQKKRELGGGFLAKLAEIPFFGESSSMQERYQCLDNVQEMYRHWAPGSPVPPKGDAWYGGE